MAASRCSCAFLRRLDSFRPPYLCHRAIASFSFAKHLNVKRIFLQRYSQAQLYGSLINNAQNSSRWPPYDETRYYSSQESKVNILNEPTAFKADAEKETSENARKDEEKRKKDEFQRRATKYTLIFLAIMCSGTAGYLIAVWGAPRKDDDGSIIRDEFSDMSKWKAYLYRTWNEALFYNKMIKEPSRDKLLPDPLTDPYFQPPYTLVIEMTGILVHPDWTYKTGWRFKKRPGVDFFLQQAGPPMFEIVVYTSEQGFTAYPILESLDPNGFIMYKLFRDATRYQNGHHIKDLACLNRDLSRVIIVDWNEKSFQLQPENALKLRKWTGNDDDSTLFDLAMFLRTIVASEVEDVRPVLQFYKGFEDPVAAFKENQRRLQEEEERLNRQKAETTEKPAGLAGRTWSSSLFGRR